MDKNISEDRKKYLRKIRLNKTLVFTTQIALVIGFIILWEILARFGIIDSFIASQPSRILKTFMNLSGNNLLEHLGVTCFETIVGFVSRNYYRNYSCNNIMVVELFIKGF